VARAAAADTDASVNVQVPPRMGAGSVLRWPWRVHAAQARTARLGVDLKPDVHAVAKVAVAEDASP
jgi:hypothetical protein